MSVVLNTIFALLAMGSLLIDTYIIAFYHMFDSNRESIDDHSTTAVIIFTILFFVFFRLAVSS